MNYIYSNLKLMLVAIFAFMGMSVWADEVTFTAGTDMGTSGASNNADQLVKDGVTIDFTNAATTTPQYRIYANSTMTFSCNGTITQIVVTSVANTGSNYGPDKLSADGYTTNEMIGTWTGAASEVVLSSSTQCRASSITVTFTPSETPVIAKPTLPASTTFIGSMEVAITAAEGLEIHYTTDGTDPTTASQLYTEALTLTETTTVKAIAVEATGASSGLASATYTKLATYATIAELTALANNAPFVFSGEALIVAKPTAKYVYVSDATGVALVYDASGAKTADVEVGKTIAANWSGKVSIYKNLFELVPDKAIAVNDGDAIEVTYPSVTVADIVAENVNQVVTLKDITSYTVDGKNMTITVGDAEVVGYNQFGLEIAAAEEGKTYEIIGAISRYNDNIQFQPIEIKEMTAPGPQVEDYTSYIVNADLTGQGGFDATGTKGIDGSGIVKVGSAADFNFKQTIENLPAGKYKVTAQAAYRYSGSEEAEYEAMQTENTITKFVQLYATVGSKTESQLVQNRYDGASETDLAGNGAVQVNNLWVPNSSNAVKAWFAAGLYVNEVEFDLPADGAVTIGIKRLGTPEVGDYTVLGPWTLTRIGDSEVEPIEPEVLQPGDDATSFIVNPSFETGDLTGWTVGNSSDTGVKPNSNATYTTEGVDGNYLFNTWWQGIPITQTVTGLPNGQYELKALMTNDCITAGNKPGLYLLANGEHSEAFSAPNAGVFAEGSITFYVTDGTATIGAIGGNADGTFNEAGYYWYKVDHFRLTYLAGLPDISEIEIPEGKMSNAAAEAIAAAQQAQDALALIEAVKAAEASIKAYADAAVAIEAAKTFMASTNVYTPEALRAYKAIYDEAEAKYEAGTLADADAAALENPALVTGWQHDPAKLADDLLLSTWSIGGAKAKDFDTSLYINTWSVEGETDGTEFKVPFFEYWTGDDNSLGATDITSTIEGLAPGTYDVTIWTRVRAKNGTAAADATGLTLSVNGGEAVDATEGAAVGQFNIAEYTAQGVVGEDGVLTIKFEIAEENNISWLSFKNAKYAFNEDASVTPGDADADETIDVADHAVIRDYILENEEPAYVKQYDANQDNAINAGDLTAVVNLILYGAVEGKPQETVAVRGSVSADALILSYVGDGRYALQLQSSRSYNSFQMDLVLSEGMTLLTQEVEGNHVVATNTFPSGKTRVLVYSMDNTAFESGDILYLQVAGQGTITADNIFFADAQSNVVRLALGDATGINAVDQNVNVEKAYDLSGRSVEKMQRGIYIVNGKKVAIK